MPIGLLLLTSNDNPPGSGRLPTLKGYWEEKTKNYAYALLV